MYCRCTDCHATYPIIAAQLAAAGGRVRCERCSKAFDALESLFDQWPEPGEVAPSRGLDQSQDQSTSLPLVSQPRMQSGDSKTDDTGWAGTPVATEKHPPGLAQWLSWGVAAAAFLGLLFMQTYGHPTARSWLGLPSDEAPSQAEVASSPVQLYSRDLHEHPGVEDALVLSAVLRNPETQPRPYPLLEVSLTNAGNEVIAQRRFQPEEYLDSPDPGTGEFPAEALLPLLLEFTDPGAEATGYQLEFY